MALWTFGSPLGLQLPKMAVPLGVWGPIPSHSLALPRACGMIPELPSWLVTLQPLALVVSPRLGLWQHGWRELPQCWWWFPTFILSMFKKSMITTHNLHNCLTQGCEIRHGQQKVLHVSTKSKLKLAHECRLVLWNMSHVSCLNLNMYTGAKCDPWRKVHN
jgi:hypothetical protein